MGWNHQLVEIFMFFLLSLDFGSSQGNDWELEGQERGKLQESWAKEAREPRIKTHALLMDVRGLLLYFGCDPLTVTGYYYTYIFSRGSLDTFICRWYIGGGDP